MALNETGAIEHSWRWVVIERHYWLVVGWHLLLGRTRWTRIAERYMLMRRWRILTGTEWAVRCEWARKVIWLLSCNE